MLRSMYAGVSGMKAHMDKMDVVSNNISNVNTVGYKTSRATFKTMFSQMIQGATAPQGGRGGTNPQQIGLGTTLGSIDKDMGQGSLQSTGRNSDLAIEGSGFFVVGNGNSRRYTKAGSLTKDKDGYLVNSSTGYRVKGWEADANGDIDTNAPLEDMSFKESMPAQATSKVSYEGNLNADSEASDTWNTTFETYDSQGTVHTVDLKFSKTGANQWNYEIAGISGIDDNNQDNTTLTLADGTDETDNSADAGDGEIDGLSGSISFDVNGDIVTIDGQNIEDIQDETEDNEDINFPKLQYTPSGGAEVPDDPTTDGGPEPITLDFSGLTQFSGEMTADRDTVNGYKAGSLLDYQFDSSGTITGEYDNGRQQTIGRIALASFNNPAGLTAEGETLFNVSNNSGDPNIGAPASGGLGAIKAGSLEMSNVDLSRQFTEMITTQRGFQANSKTISTSDQILQELVNLKR